MSPEEAKGTLPTANSYWQAALPAKDTKTHVPYVWLVPDKATPAEAQLQLLGRAIERQREAMKKQVLGANWAKRQLGQMQTRLDRHLKQLQIIRPPATSGLSKCSGRTRR